MEWFATKESELLGKASGSQPRIGQLVKDQVGVDQGAEEMESLVQKISTEESTNYEISIQQSWSSLKRSL